MQMFLSVFFLCHFIFQAYGAEEPSCGDNGKRKKGNSMCTSIDLAECDKTYIVQQSQGFFCNIRDLNCLATKLCSAGAYNLREDPNTLAYFDFGTTAGAQSWNGSASTVTDLGTRGNNFQIANAAKSKFSLGTGNGGFLKTNTAEVPRTEAPDVGLVLSGEYQAPLAMGVWVKPSKQSDGVMWWGDPRQNDKSFWVEMSGSKFYSKNWHAVRPYDFGVARDSTNPSNPGDRWWDSTRLNPTTGTEQRAYDYITSIPDHQNLWYCYVVYDDGQGNIYSSVDGSDLALLQGPDGSMVWYKTSDGSTFGRSKEQGTQTQMNPVMAIGGRKSKEADGGSGHSYGVAFWYQGEFTSSQARGFWDQYASRFDRSA